MNPVALVTIVALVAVSTALGLLWRARTGRVVAASSASGVRVTLPEVPTGSVVTLLQFSTAVCAPCKPTRVLLGELAASHDGVQHVDIDLTDRPDIASQFNVLQTPTTLVLDRDGVITSRIGGAPRAADVRAAVETLLAR